MTLTKRQAMVVELMIRGRLVKQIAEDLRISERTVKAFREQARERMGAKTSCELVARYLYAQFEENSVKSNFAHSFVSR